MSRTKDYIYDLEYGRFEEPNKFTEEQHKQMEKDFNDYGDTLWSGWTYEEVKYGR